MNKKKLLIFHPALPPYRIDMFNSFAEYFDTTFYFENKNLMNQKFDQIELKKHIHFKCNYLTKGFNLKGRAIRFGIKEVIQKHNPDIILSTEFGLLTLFAVVGVRNMSSKPKIYTITEDNIPMLKVMSGYQIFLRKYFASKIDGIIFTHDLVKNWFAENIIQPKRGLVLPTIRQEKEFISLVKSSTSIANDLMRKYSIQEKNVILYVGRFAVVKNLERLISSFGRIIKEKKDVRLILVGAGPIENKLKQIVNEANLNQNVILPGRFEGLELLAWYNLSDIFILPSTYEPFGAVINEALLSGCYTLTSNLAGGACLIEENINGNTFDPYSIDDMSRCIQNALNRKEMKSKKSLMNILYDETFESVASQM